MRLQFYFILLTICCSTAQPNLTSKSISQINEQDHQLIASKSVKFLQNKTAATLKSDNIYRPKTNLRSKASRDDKSILIKKKRKRYRRLRKEMKEIRWFLEANKAKKGTVTKDGKIERCRANCDWRKRFSIKWKRLNARVKRLEAWRRNKSTAKTIRDYDEVFGRVSKGSRSVEVKTEWEPKQVSQMETSVEHTEKKQNLDLLFSSVNQSLNGESGRPCRAHQDCKAGLCCHQFSGNSTGPISFCINYKLRENEFCKDTCQCEAHLHCILGSTSLLSSNNTTAELGICKKVSKTNFGNGKYLDAKTLVFSDEHSS